MTQITRPPPTTPYYIRHFQIFNKIYSFLKNISNVPDSKKCKFHLWGTALFIYNCWLTFLSCVVNSRRKENQAEENRYLIWTADWSGEYNTPRDVECTDYFLFSNCSNESYFLNLNNSALFLIEGIHSTANSKS